MPSKALEEQDIQAEFERCYQNLSHNAKGRVDKYYKPVIAHLMLSDKTYVSKSVLYDEELGNKHEISEKNLLQSLAHFESFWPENYEELEEEPGTLEKWGGNTYKIEGVTFRDLHEAHEFLDRN